MRADYSLRGGTKREDCSLRETTPGPSPLALPLLLRLQTAVAGATQGTPVHGTSEAETQTSRLRREPGEATERSAGAALGLAEAQGVGKRKTPGMGSGGKQEQEKGVAEIRGLQQGMGPGVEQTCNVGEEGECPTVAALLSPLLDFQANPIAAHVAGCVLECAATSPLILLVRLRRMHASPNARCIPGTRNVYLVIP